MKIACWHLYNDYSGSPKVLKTVLEGLLRRGHEVELYTTAGGPLDDLRRYPNFKMRAYRYAYSPSGAVTMARYAWAQLLTFGMAFRHYLFSKTKIFYINTLLPIGPAFFGLLNDRRIIYHYHENADAKGKVYKFLAGAMKLLADRIICVSGYQAKLLKTDKSTVVPNALDPGFAVRLKPDFDAAYERRNVLMISSLKEYKGARQFAQLARISPSLRFALVINDTQEAIDAFFAGEELPSNLKMFPRQPDVADFYNDASVVVNLSNPDQFIETFGLTALEAMTAGLPVIVPEVGGIAEMVKDGVNGYKISVHRLDDVASTLNSMMTDKKLYMSLAQGALDTSRRYDAEAQITAIEYILES